MKKALCLALTLVFIFMLTVPFAAEREVKYVCLGDSISAGYGLKDFEEGIFEIPSEAFPAVVSEALGFTCESLAMSGAKIKEMMCLVGGIDKATYISEEGDGFTNPNEAVIPKSISEGAYNPIYKKFCYQNVYSYCAIIDKTGSGSGKSQDIIKNADIITVEIGSNDILTTPIVKSDLAVALYFGDEVTEKMILDTIKYVYESYNYICDQFPKLLERIHTLNPDIKIAVVGLYNPFENFSVLPYGVKIGAVLNTVVNSVNEFYKKAVKEYNKKYNTGAVYIDVTGAGDYFSDISVFDLDSDDNQTMINYIHPTAEGANYIAQQVISALADYSTKPLTSPIEGTYNIAIGGNNIGTYTLSSVGNLWYIKNSRGKYLALNTVTNKLTETKVAYGWTFENGAFCSYSTSSVVGLFKNKKLTPYYLGISGGALSIVTTPAATTFTNILFVKDVILKN